MKAIFAITWRLLISDDIGARHRMLMSRVTFGYPCCVLFLHENVKSVYSLSRKSTPVQTPSQVLDTSRTAGLAKGKRRKGWEIEALSSWCLLEWINKSLDCSVACWEPDVHGVVEPSLGDKGRLGGLSATPWSTHLRTSPLVTIQMCKKLVWCTCACTSHSESWVQHSDASHNAQCCCCLIHHKASLLSVSTPTRTFNLYYETQKA